jgi:hypothetical protein
LAEKANKWTPFWGNPHLNEPLEEDILGKDEITSSHGVASTLTQMYFLWDPEMESKGHCELSTHQRTIHWMPIIIQLLLLGFPFVG